METSEAALKPLRILHIFRAPLGGLFRHVLDVAKAQAERGHEVGIFCDSSTGGERADRLLSELEPHLNLGVHRVRMFRNPHPADAYAVLRLEELYLRLKPDVLHGHGSKGGAYARLIVSPRWHGKAIRAYTPHGGSFNYSPGTLLHKIYMSIEKILALGTDVFLFESSFIRGRFDDGVGKTDRIVRVVHNGIEESEFEPVVRTGDAKDLVYVGELRPAKGVETLIDALGILKQAHGKLLSLLIVGSGPSEESLKKRAKSRGLGNVITFAPPQPIRAALAQGGIMVIPSHAESLPYVILEAAAAAQPLVSTDVGGIPEIFGPYSYQLIKPGDPEAITNALLKKYQEPEEERREAAKALSTFVKSRFSIHKMVDGVLDGYRSAFERKGRDDINAF